MSNPENFLSRWSRRKREAAEEWEQQRQGDADAPAGDSAAQAGEAPPSAQVAEPLVDLAKLPSIDQITAETDISGFLVPGVPAELKTAALRRAWLADPKVRDFVGLQDYDFDFHTPGAIPGFGPLEMTEELRREVGRILGNVLPDEKPASQPDAPGSEEAPQTLAQPTADIEETVSAASPAAMSTVDTASLRADEMSHSAADAQLKPPVTPCVEDHAASQHSIAGGENLQMPARRSHGGALPK
jgi:hypothetical protein